MPSGAELQRSKLLRALGLENTPGIDGARLEQIFDEYLPVVTDQDGNFVGRAATATFGSLGVGRFIKRANAGEDLLIVALGDSVLEGNTVDNPATDGTLKLLATGLSSRFPGTITEQNYAVSGYTSAAAFINGKVNDALVAGGDLYIIAFGKNDGGWEREPSTDWPVPGYPQDASIAAIEQMVLLIRDRVPKADIILMGENPYTPILSTANTLLQSYNADLKKLAVSYGIQYIDNYNSFVTSTLSLGTLVPDGTHPGTVGHRLMADTILSYFPVNYSGVSVASSVNPDRTRAGSQSINLDTSLQGWFDRNKTGSIPGEWSWVNTGTWTDTAGQAPYSTTTVGSYAEFTFNGTELLLTLNTTAAASAVVDVTVDGVPLYNDRSLSNGKQGSAYLVPIATGLSKAQHTVRITLVSGTLTIHRASWTVSKPSHVPDTLVVDLGSGTTETVIDTGGAVTYIINSAAAVPLPVGWTAMDIEIVGYVNIVVKAATTTDRLIQCNLRTDTVLKQTHQKTIVPRSAGEHIDAFTIAHAEPNKTAAVGIRFEVRLQSTDKTNTFYRSWGLQAICHRRS